MFEQKNWNLDEILMEIVIFFNFLLKFGIFVDVMLKITFVAAAVEIVMARTARAGTWLRFDIGDILIRVLITTANLFVGIVLLI